jgi:aspartate aminotransferase
MAPSRLAATAAGMAGSTILQIVADVAARKAAGHPVCDLTMGDFDPRQFPIPAELAAGIELALRNGQTSYPPGAGMPALRQSIRAFTLDGMGLDYPVESVLVTSGARPGIYAAYRTLVDAGDRVVYAVPSWQNSYYCQLVGATPVVLSCDASTQFLPTRAALEPLVRGARLLALNSPLNPTGTMFDAATLGDICDLVLEENARRTSRERPLYLLYDQVYWMLTFGVPHVTPVALRPAMAPYTISIDAISKSFAATGLRVGWAVGPADVIRSMGDLLSHVGTWAPRPEQVAVAMLLTSRETIGEYHREMRLGLRVRLDALYGGIMRMRASGLPVDAMAPAGAIYLSAQFSLPLADNEERRRYLLEEADFAAIPFQGFGVTGDSAWFRLSAGAVSPADIEAVLPKVAAAVRASMPASPSLRPLSRA